MRVSLPVLLVACVPAVALAQRPDRVEQFATMDLITTSVDAAHARASGFGARGWGGTIGAGMEYLRALAIGLDGSFMRHSDTQQFRQSTTRGTKRSFVDAWSGSVWAGLRAPAMARLVVGANGGFQGFSASRTIPDCVDCRVDKLSLNGGMFVEPVAYIRRPGVGGHVAYRHFLGDGHVRSSLLIGARITSR